MISKFEIKTTEAAAFLLRNAGGSMNYLKLIKLLYLADRKAIKENGLPITFDNYCSMENGPVLSKTYDWIKGNTHPDYGDLWNSHIRLESRYDVGLFVDIENSHLSEDEINILNDILLEYGKYTPFQLVEITHRLPEYKTPPSHSSYPITNHELINVLEDDENERKSLLKDIELYKLINS